MNKILVVDDDDNLVEVIKYNLEEDGYDVITAVNGMEALQLARHESPDLIVLDVMLPELDGLEVCRILRQEISVPILMLTAKNQEIDKIVGLEVGADDYMTKPFSVRELRARIRAMLRRLKWTDRQTVPDYNDEKTLPSNIKVGALEMDVVGHRVIRDGTDVQLSPKEFDLLLFLMRHRGQFFSREHLIEQVWGYDYNGTARTVDVHIRSLRQKLEYNPEKPVNILTIHGHGYKFNG